ncbi:gamma-tubulin complex component 5 [Diachasma alloeum]|uniref:gamma-tubulin complex component 5 n=1 Tax=Diachasma alloeum TaxID=454923 RepID=UPI0007381254|nr:gamma-tubulin complex component 5 [Diachasma alloeum]
MGSRILNDIQNDLKLLITSLTGFEESDEGYPLCERYVFSNMKHHRFLSINSHAVKRTIAELEQKFRIYGKYNVAREFKTLVENFLTSFDFEHHPQYDLQWSLLGLLLNLSRDTAKSEIDCLHTTKVDKTLTSSASEEVDEIDWGEHLKEGEAIFFAKYASSSESEWSDDDDEKLSKLFINPEKPQKFDNELCLPSLQSPNPLRDQKTPSIFKVVIESRNWLDSNVENTWWNMINPCDTKPNSNFSHVHLFKIYNKEILNNSKSVVIITEYQACRELLWMFQVPIEMIIFKKKSLNSFYVKENVSITRLTPESFHSAFSTFCRYLEMINRINLFGKSIYNIYEGGGLPPLTLEVYNSSIKDYYRDVKKKIIEIEQRVMKQNDINTFLTLSRELEVHLDILETLDEVHRSLVLPGNDENNWKKAYKLLLSIYKEMENSSSRKRTNLCASLYLSSLKVYLNIIDTWLSEGRLEDFRHEFLISKVKRKNFEAQDKEENGSSSSLWRIKFIMLENEEPETLDPIMKKLFRKVRDMGRSIELLVTLDRISDMWRINSEQFEERIPLCEEFTRRVLEGLEKFGGADEIDDVEEVNIIMESDSDVLSEQRFTELEENIRQQVLRINNSFLMKVFQKYLPPINVDVIDCKGDETTKACRESCSGIQIFKRLEKMSRYVLPFRKVLEEVLDEILDRRYSCAAKLVKDILINEYKLEKHLRLMRSVFMMERGHVMTRFYQMMFSDVERNVSVTNTENLTHLLEEVLSDEWRDSSSHNRWSISLKDVCARQVLQAVDHIMLNYDADWPINMVLTKEALKKYNGIFRFGLKLKWALWALNNLRFTDLEGKDSVNMNDMLHHFHTRRLESLRFWLLHAIGSIHSYLCGQVLQSLGLILEQELTMADSLDAIIQAHNEYLEKVHVHCLQTSQFSDIMVTINNLLGMCVHVRERWQHGAKQLIASELDLMESSFTKYHTYLALALHNAVQYKEADYLAGLTSAFN